jgi:uncharacterized delta-60 repeat protein
VLVYAGDTVQYIRAAVVLKPDGTIVVATDDGSLGGQSLRGYDALGRVQGNLGGGGLASGQPASSGVSAYGSTWWIGPAFSTRAIRVASQTDGKIVVVRSQGFSEPRDSNLIVERYNTDGTLDTTFGNGGSVISMDAGPCDVGVQPDGKIVTLIETAAFAGYLLRYDPAGNLDTTFGGGYILAGAFYTDWRAGYV